MDVWTLFDSAGLSAAGGEATPAGGPLSLAAPVSQPFRTPGGHPRVCPPPPPAPLLLVRQPDPGVAAEPLAVVVGLQSGRMDAVHGEFLITVLGVARHPDRADNLALRVAD